MKINLRPTTVNSLSPNAWKYVLFRFDFDRSLSEASIDKHKRYRVTSYNVTQQLPNETFLTRPVLMEGS
jgi:hypothetical protein